MKITILGTAAATSMPLAFCNCTVCKKARLLGGKNFRKRASAVINDELLIDLGPDSVNACSMYGIDNGSIKYLLQTHSHSDHFDAGHFVTRMSAYAVKDLTHLSIICSAGTADDMNHMIKENEDIDLCSKKWMEDLNYDLRLIKHGDNIEVDGYKIIAIDSRHDTNIESMIYIIAQEDKYVLYGTDLLELTDEAWEILGRYKFDAVFFDQTYGAGYNAGGHLDADMVNEYVSRMKVSGMIGARTLVFATHISHEGNDIHEAMETMAAANGYHIAYDGMSIEI